MTHLEFKAWLKKCEGYSNKPYVDTVGKTTIGWGRNLSDVGISPEEAELLFINDLKRAVIHLQGRNFFEKSPEPVQAALINMCFNLGITRLLGFKKMITALEAGNYKVAASEALNSKWASQVGNRAKDIALMILDGKDELKTGADASY